MNEFGTFRVVPISAIKIQDRTRQDFGDIEDLARDIKRRGLLQPIVLDQRLNLGDGGRRIKAYELLGLDDIPALVKPIEEPIDLHELELVANLQRKDFSWIEKVNLVAKIHSEYLVKDANWSGRKTATRIGMSKSVVAANIQLAEAIAEVPALEECESEQAAMRMLSNLEEELYLREIAKRREKETKETQELIDRANTFMEENNIPRARDKQSSSGDATYEEDLIDENVDPSEEEPTQEEFKLTDYNVGDFLALAKRLPDEILGMNSLVECDPPYGINLRQVKKGDSVDDNYNEIDAINYTKFVQDTCDQCYRLLGDDSTLIFWFGIEWYSRVKGCLETSGFKVNVVPAIWLKTNSSGQSNKPKHLLSNVYETFFVARKGSTTLGKPGSKNVFSYDVVPANKKIHPTEKPTNLLMDIIQTTMVITNQTKCMIPFLGSGVTLIACHKLGIPSFGFDMSETYKNAYLAKIGVKDESN